MSRPASQNRLVAKRAPRRVPAKAGEGELDDYELKLDDQVGHFLQINHTLTYFVITAAVGTFGFTVNLLITNKLLSGSNPWGIRGIATAALASLLGAASSLIALRCDVRSYQLHLGYRHKRKRFVDLSTEEQAAWDRLNKWAKRAREASFVFLGITVLVQFVLILFLVIQTRESTPAPSVFSSFFQ